MPRLRRVGLATALAAVPVALAYRFALVYRGRAGFPARVAPRRSPGELGLAFEETVVRSAAGALPAWFIPARGGLAGPGVALVHGWESARDRLLPHILFLNAAGFHCLTFDVRGHGANPAEALPISGGEFQADALAALDALLARPEVTGGALFGHSMGGVGAILAAADDPRCGALVSCSAPADPRHLTRQTFRLAHLPIPDPIAVPLAWLTARVYVRPRGHSVHAITASRAIARYGGPILVVHGAVDTVVPPGDLDRLVRAARRGRSRIANPQPVESLLLPGGRHSWLYEDERFRRTVAAFLARSLGGPYSPEEAAERAGQTFCVRPPEGEAPFDALVDLPAPVRLMTGMAAGARSASAAAPASGVVGGSLPSHRGGSA
ncbi:MAG TPA: alpha/beta fold hydrolase [Candidatus Limnocylindrales bacterium]